MNKRAEMYFVIALLILGAAVRMHFFATTHNLFSVEAESYSKIHLMLQWDQSPLLYPDINFGPAHMPLLKWPWKLTGSLVTANRAVSLLFGIALLPFAYLLARRLFGSVAALGTLAFLSLSMLAIKTSTVTLAEGPCAFSMVLGLYLITVYTDKKTDHWGLFIGAAAALALMTALRFETWLFLPIIPIWLWIKKGFARAAGFALLLALFPILHLYVCWSKMGDPFHFLHTSAVITALNSAKVEIGQRALGFIKSLGYTCSWGLMILFPIGIVIAIKQKKGSLVVAMLLAMLAMYEYKGIKATLAPELFRYLTVPCILISLVWALPITEGLGGFFKKRGWGMAILVITIGMALGGWSYASALKEERLMQPAKGVYEMLKQLRPVVKDTDRIFLGSEYHPVIVVESGLGWNNFRLPLYPNNETASTDSIEELFEQYKPNAMLVFTYDHLYEKVLKLRPPCKERHDIFNTSFCRQFRQGDWCWYRLCDEAQ